jgi:hypothetical protein
LKLYLLTLFFFVLTFSVYSQAEKETDKSIYIFPILDAPFNTNFGSIKTSNKSHVPSMEQSINFTKNSIQLSHRYMLYNFDTMKFMNDYPIFKFMGIMTFDFLFYAIPLPLNLTWLHEEWHRAVMGNKRISSSNNLYETGEILDTTNVSDVKDSELIRLKKDYPRDMIRLSSAGMESQTQLNLLLRKDTFFNGTNQYSDIPTLWINAFDNINYLQTCSNKIVDSLTWQANLTERDPNRRDFVGFDCTAWVYDLYRPNEPYTNRGVHIYGNGVDRYIKYSNDKDLFTSELNKIVYGSEKHQSDLTDKEQDYLKKQYNLSYINFINPALLGFTRFNGKNPFNGRDFYWNFGMSHFLTPFGYSIDSQFFLKQDNIYLLIIYHSNINNLKKFPGLEVELIRYPLTLLQKNLFFNIGIHIWQQPLLLQFFTEDKENGGSLKSTIAFPIHNNLEFYVSTLIKSRGFMVGNIYLERAYELRLGLNLVF